MNTIELLELVPKHKFDDSSFKRLREISEVEIKAILPGLFEWIADYNWPIAKELTEILTSFPETLQPYLKKALSVECNDGDLKDTIIIHIIPNLPRKNQEDLIPELKRICERPIVSERYGTNENAEDFLKEYRSERKR